MNCDAVLQFECLRANFKMLETVLVNTSTACSVPNCISKLPCTLIIIFLIKIYVFCDGFQVTKQTLYQWSKILTSSG